MFDVQQFRQQFPYFSQPNNAIYLDNAATTLRPQCLIDATCAFYQSAGSVHRSQYDESQTASFEQARKLVQKRFNVESERAVIWTSGATQSLNMIAYGLMSYFSVDDEIIISAADHHAHFVTWQQIAQKCGAKLRILSLQPNGLIDETDLVQALNARTKLVALNAVSNVTGTEQPLAHLISLIREKSQAWISVDCAQAVSHCVIDVQKLGADFYSFSSHKFYGPTGLGVLMGKLASLELLQPLNFGGKMVETVTDLQSTFSPLPYRLEAGTPNIAAVIGFGSVLQWLSSWDFEQGEQHAISLAQKTKQLLKTLPNCRIFDSAIPSAVVSFAFDDIATSDIATLLVEQNIALRTGSHCAQPYHQFLGVDLTLRLSFAPYNTAEEVEQFWQALQSALELLA